LAAHFQLAGHSLSVVQVVTLGWQVPGKVVMVVQVGGGGGGVVDPVDPVEEAPPPEQAPITEGWHSKPSPQSALALQGSCHLKAQALTVVVRQSSGVVGTGASHLVFGAQGGTAPPPEQVVLVSLWQTMPPPQSPSLSHALA
jgi:hypothetical protein